MEYQIQFPDPELADDDGLIAVGGELTPEYLISAYVKGIFPWFGEGDPILWWSPNPRLVLYPENFKVSKTLAKLVKSDRFELKIDTSFSSVIKSCSKIKRPDQEGSWITDEMIAAYCTLHDLGIAHSFETYLDGKLVGGLYGLSMGKAFFGESMFFKERDASKFAFYHLVSWCKAHDFHFIDAQQPTNHLKSLGAKEIERNAFLAELNEALQFETIQGKWTQTI
jgi:leucyl/phenylalanyl-tRNA---protein transferase